MEVFFIGCTKNRRNYSLVAQKTDDKIHRLHKKFIAMKNTGFTVVDRRDRLSKLHKFLCIEEVWNPIFR